MTYRPLKIDGRTRLGQGVKAAQMLTKAMHDPHFARQFWCWSRMRNRKDEALAEFIDDTGYCLDRTDLGDEKFPKPPENKA